MRDSRKKQQELESYDGTPGDGMFERLLDREPWLKYLREIGTSKIRALMRRAVDECSWCGGSLVGKPRLAMYCTPACCHEVRIRCDAQYRSKFIRKLSKNACALCGSHPSTCQKWRETWQVDHVKPICEGGGLTGSSNLRLLCGTCHGIVSGLMRTRQAQERKVGACDA